MPGSHAAISIETPLPSPSVLLPSGSARDEIRVQLHDDDDESSTTPIPVTLIDCGLPVIFVPASALSAVLPPALLTAHPAQLDAHGASMRLLERVRVQGARLSERVWANFSPPAPKVCVVDARTAYASTGGEQVARGDMDLLIRSISVGVSVRWACC